MNEQMYKQITALEQDIYELAGEIFNINSPKQLGDIYSINWACQL